MSISLSTALIALAFVDLLIVLIVLYGAPRDSSQPWLGKRGARKRPDNRKCLAVSGGLCDRAVLPQEWKSRKFYPITATQLRLQNGKFWMHYMDNVRVTGLAAGPVSLELCRQRLFLN